MHFQKFFYFLATVSIGFIIDFTISIGLMLYANVGTSIAVIFGFIFGAISNYLLNQKYVFQKVNRNFKKLIIYIMFMLILIFIRISLINIMNLILSNDLLFLSVLIASLVTLIINFLVSKFYLFIEHNDV